MDGGKSNGFLFVTDNKKFVIKIITNEEKTVLLGIFRKYFDRVINNPDSKLVRIFGLFTILPEKVHLIVMGNLIPYRENRVIFDLKGSFLNRKVGIDNFPIFDKVLKDQNFIESNIKLCLSNENIKLLTILKEDFEILYKQNIMDYSLILAIPVDKIGISGQIKYSEDINIGIIDILQKYNLSKISEKNLKGLFYKTEDISSADPSSYFTRINNFLSKVFLY